MRTDLLWAGGLAALVVGATVVVGRAATRQKEASRANAVSITQVVLLETPIDTARASGFLMAGEAAILDPTGAPGWVYVTAPEGGGEGYALEKDFAYIKTNERAVNGQAPISAIVRKVKV